VSDLSQAFLANTFGPRAAILNWNSIAVKTGTLSSIAANAPLFSFRNIGGNVAWLRNLSVAFNATTAFSPVQALDFGLVICRAFLASDSGGTPIILSGTNDARFRTTQVAFSACDLRVSSTAALVAGTRTLDANNVSIASGWANTVGVVIPPLSLIDFSEGDYPLTFAINEGFVIQLGAAMSAAGAGGLYVSAEIIEIFAPTWPI
jgi:hypothetical protein